MKYQPLRLALAAPLLLLCAWPRTSIAQAAISYAVVAWGNNSWDQTTIPLEAQSGAVAIAAGYEHTVALKSDGSVVAWGSNDYDLTTIPLAAQSGVTAISAGAAHAVALKADGSVVAWGNNRYGEVTGTPTTKAPYSAIASPVTLGGQVLSSVTAIAAGGAHTFALKNDGSVVTWYGQETVPITAQSGVTAIAAGTWHTVALVIPTVPSITTRPVSQAVNERRSASFTVVATGSPLNYQWRKDDVDLAGATSPTYSLPFAQTNHAGNYTVVVSNSAGSVTSAPPAVLTVNPAPPGSVVAWGWNESGQTDVPAGLSSVTAIAAGGGHTVALKNDGSVVAWGNNHSGQTDVPAGLSSVTAIAAGGDHTVALKNDGSVVAWGNNHSGQADVPVAAQRGVIAIAAGWEHTVALKNDGSVVAWGLNESGQTTVPVAAKSAVVAIAAGAKNTVALKNDASVLAWGEVWNGATLVPISVPSGLSGVMAIAAGDSHTVALKNDGSVVAWGWNDFGQTIVPLAAQSGVTAITAGQLHTVALMSDGSVVAWGDNALGQTDVPPSPSRVTAIAAGYLYTVALIGGVPLLPSLKARPNGNELILSWPTNAPGFTLQSTLDLTPPVTWLDSPSMPAVIGAHFTHQQHFRRRQALSAEKNVARRESSHVRLAGNFKTRGMIGQPKTPCTGDTTTSGARRLNNGMNLMKTNSISTSLAVHARTTATTQHLAFRCARLWTGFLAFAALAFGPQPAQAAVTEAWVQLYSNVVTHSHDRAIKVVHDAAGDIIVTGTTAGGIPRADILTIKYSGADGSVLWQQRYNSPENGPDHPSALAVDPSGNVVVTGRSSSRDFYTAKYAAADGALLWERRYNSGTDAVTDFGSLEFFTDQGLAVDGSGNVVVTGNSWDGTDKDYYTVKYAAADGALLWEKRYNGPANSDDEARAVAVDGSGNVVVTGTSGYDYYTAKYAAADGVLLWERRYDGPANLGDLVSALAVDGSGNVVVTGSSTARFDSFGYSISDYYTAKYAAADGALLWERRYNGSADLDDLVSALALDGGGNVVVTGHSASRVDSFGNYVNDYYTAKYAAVDGAVLWEKRYGVADGDVSANAVAVDGSGNVVVTGTSFSDYYTAKYVAADGALLWEQRYDGPSNAWDIANAVSLDASGNVVVTGLSWTWGASWGNGLDGDYYTAKYAAVDGALLWEQRYDGSAPSGASAREVAVDGSGNIAVTGVAYSSYPNGSPIDVDSYTAKYASADGALLWEKRYDGPSNASDIANAVSVDGSGNVVVTGYSDKAEDYYTAYYTAKYAAADGALLWEKREGRGSAIAVAVDGSGNVVVTGTWFDTLNSHGDFRTAKYAAADGALLWEKRYNGPANSIDIATAVAVDGNDDVVVTGYSGTWPNYDYYTAKYAAADGALLWEKRYDGPNNSNDYASAVAVDGSGNVVVTGNSGFYPNYDYYTAKYAAADGALLWEKRFTGPASVGDSSHCLALGPDGRVAVTGGSFGHNEIFNGGYATVVYREVPAVSIDLSSTGVRLRVTGLPGRSYHIERALAVTGPWSTISTQTAPESGPFEYRDTNPPAAAAFYRASEP